MLSERCNSILTFTFSEYLIRQVIDNQRHCMTLTLVIHFLCVLCIVWNKPHLFFLSQFPQAPGWKGLWISPLMQKLPFVCAQLNFTPTFVMQNVCVFLSKTERGTALSQMLISVWCSVKHPIGGVCIYAVICKWHALETCSWGRSTPSDIEQCKGQSICVFPFKFTGAQKAAQKRHMYSLALLKMFHKKCG